MHRLNWIGCGLFFGFALWLPLQGCSSRSDVGTPSDEAPHLGSIELKLTTNTQRGIEYRLRDAVLVMEGPGEPLVFNSEYNPELQVWRALAVEGEYTYTLWDGWRMERLSDGEVTDVPAQQIADNNQFYVYENQTTPVQLHFRVGDDVSGQGAVEVSLQVDELDLYCADNNDCPGNMVCCPAGGSGICLDVNAGASCPRPDLTLDENLLQRSLSIAKEVIASDSFALQEGCVGGPGQRRLLKFTTDILNIGWLDLILGSPADSQHFEYDEVHGHYHYPDFVTYELLASGGVLVAQGQMQVFCFYGNHSVVSGADSEFYSCDFQGIAAGWGHSLDSFMDCQWVDITDVPVGDYTLRVKVNNGYMVEESDYNNNLAQVPVHIGEPEQAETCNDQRGTERDCGWFPAPEYQGMQCTPGEELEASCGCDCMGYPMLRICEGTEQCSIDADVGTSDYGCGNCPVLRFNCPSSGTISAFTGASEFGKEYECPLTIAPIGSSSAEFDAGAY